jgi:hypothetical protein
MRDKIHENCKVAHVSIFHCCHVVGNIMISEPIDITTHYSNKIFKSHGS